MKRIISLILTVFTVLAVISGCAGEGTVTNTEAETKPAETTAEVTTEEVTTEEVTTEPETTEEITTEPETTEPTFPEPDQAVLDAPAATDFQVTHVFGNDMVIQRNEYIRVWGFADIGQEGKRVNAEFAGLTGAALVKDGHFMITLNGSLPECTEGRDFRVYGDGVEFVYTGVLVGDVYWVVGQSNVAYPVSSIKAEPLASAAGKNCVISNDDLIRLNRSSMTDANNGLKQGTPEVNEDTPVKRGWQKPKSGAYQFAAIGFFTGKQLYDKLEGKIPIGLIEFDAGGAALNAFCPNEVCDKLNIDKLNSKTGVYSGPSVNNNPSRFMYNHYMYPFQNFPICGLIWYQGESDCNSNNDTKYNDRFKALIEEYRSRHDLINRNYPVFVIEFPPIFQAFPYDSIRQHMGLIPNNVPNSHMCQSSDLWKDRTYENNLHPYCKWEQAERLTNIILANIYGIGDPEYVEGPSAVSVEFSDGGTTATVKFRNVGDGLRAEGGELKGFYVKLSAKLVVPDSVEIVGKDTVVLKTSKKIKSVHYNAKLEDTFPETVNLCNSAGVPCNSFIIK